MNFVECNRETTMSPVKVVAVDEAHNAFWEEEQHGISIGLVKAMRARGPSGYLWVPSRHTMSMQERQRTSSSNSTEKVQLRRADPTFVDSAGAGNRVRGVGALQGCQTRRKPQFRTMLVRGFLGASWRSGESSFGTRQEARPELDWQQVQPLREEARLRGALLHACLRRMLRDYPRDCAPTPQRGVSTKNGETPIWVRRIPVGRCW